MKKQKEGYIEDLLDEVAEEHNKRQSKENNKEQSEENNEYDSKENKTLKIRESEKNKSDFSYEINLNKKKNSNWISNKVSNLAMGGCLIGILGSAVYLYYDYQKFIQEETKTPAIDQIRKEYHLNEESSINETYFREIFIKNIHMSDVDSSFYLLEDNIVHELKIKEDNIIEIGKNQYRYQFSDTKNNKILLERLP